MPSSRAVSDKRADELRLRLASSDPASSRFPFNGMELSRADVKWLLERHESGGKRGPVQWNGEVAREQPRQGLDLRGARLQRVDLSGLPLARVLLGSPLEGVQPNEAAAAANLESAVLEGADLRGAAMTGAILVKTNLRKAKLDQARLV